MDPAAAGFPPFTEGDVLVCEGCGLVEIATGVLWEARPPTDLARIHRSSMRSGARTRCGPEVLTGRGGRRRDSDCAGRPPLLGSSRRGGSQAAASLVRRRLRPGSAAASFSTSDSV
jgi:hypothetical protein